MQETLFSILQKIILFKRKIIKNKQKTFKKILIIRNDNLGDLILSLPAIVLIRQNYPKASIYVLINTVNRDLFNCFDIIDGIISYDKNSKIFNKIITYFKILISRFDVSLELAHGDTLESAVLSFLSFIPCRFGFNVSKHGILYTNAVKPDIVDKFESDISCDVAKLICNKFETKKIKIKLNNELKQKWAEKIYSNKDKENKVIVGINIGVSNINPIKAWDIKNFAGFINRINKIFNNCIVVIIGTKKERKLFVNLQNYLDCDVKDFVGKTSLLDLIHLISNFDIFVGNNTGSMQVSVLLDIVSIVINGPSSVKRWGPQDLKKHAIIRRDLECNKIDCRNIYNCMKKYECINSIDVDDVFNVFQEKIKGKRIG